jgi:hypothetical protein
MQSEELTKEHHLKILFCRVQVAHACNPSYSGDRDQEDGGLTPGWANSSRDPISKKPITKIGLVE